MTAADGGAALPILQRLWLYQRERFRLVTTAPLLAVFAASGVGVSARLAQRPLPPLPAFAVAFGVALVLFFQLRVADEVKDRETDRRFRPDLPVPRGLVTLPLIAGLGLAGVPVAMALTYALDIRLLGLLAIVWAWMALMTAEFFAPTWLRARPGIYLASHMAIVPLIALFITACEWVPAGAAPPAGLWPFLALSFLNGCVLEIGRKIRAPADERDGVETYSGLVGHRNAMLIWCALLMGSFGFLAIVGGELGASGAIVAIGLIGLGAAFAGAAAFFLNPMAASRGRIEALAGLWVLVSYGASAVAALVS